LALDHVWKRYARGARTRVALRDVCLEVEVGEVVAVWGRGRSGRSTLLRVAAGIEPPSEGIVRFDDQALKDAPQLGTAHGIGYATTRFARMLGESVLEHVAAPLLAGSSSTLRAQACAHEALRRVDASACSEREPDELDHTETIRVSLARAIVTQPRLLLVDEPTDGVPPATKRDAVLELLRSIAHRDGVAVLMTVDEGTDLAGADRALSIDMGELRGETTAKPARVVQLRRNLS
jgi:ABC-type methionine transport system ATPase subunit